MHSSLSASRAQMASGVSRASYSATAVALARRAGIDVEMPDAVSGHVCGGSRSDVQVPGNPRPAPAAAVAALDTRAREMDRWMAR
ncbi:hypothetical protein [Streptomyces eurythermus]|uniref:hypothetical protein n=1 Tax=Streptomyces eurythermus TaxID=42237 RepID=UPI0036F76352